MKFISSKYGLSLSKLFIFMLLAVPLLAVPLLTGCSSKSKTGEDENGLSEAELAAQRDNRFGSGSIPTAEGEGLFKDIYFDYDSSVISDSARQRIEADVETLRGYPKMRIQLEGHTDERGTNDYNMALGSTRAKAVRDVMVSLGVSASKLEIISYGEEVPLVQGSSEMAYAKNRRVHLAPLEQQK